MNVAFENRVPTRFREKVFFFNSTLKAIIVSLEGRCPPWTIFLSIVIDDLSSRELEEFGDSISNLKRKRFFFNRIIWKY